MITRQNISYDVNQVRILTLTHGRAFFCGKCILCYVKGTVHFGLSFTHHPDLSVIGYSNADWACCVETRRSTYDYSIFVGKILSLGAQRSNPLSPGLVVNLNTKPWLMLRLRLFGLANLLLELHALPPDRLALLCDNKSYIFKPKSICS